MQIKGRGINQAVNIRLIGKILGTSGDDLLQSFVEIRGIDILIVLDEFMVGIAGQGMPFEKDQALAFERQGIFVQLVEIKDTVGDLDDEFGVFRYITAPDITKTAVYDDIGDLGFDIVQPVVFCLE